MSLVLLLGLLLAAACGDDSEAPLAILDITQGRAEIKTFGAADFVAGSDGEDLAAGDAVRVPEGSRAAVVFFEGSAVILEKGVELTIQRLTGSAESGVSNIELFQLAGRTFHRVNKLVDAESSYVMRTSSALGVVRGTGFVVQDDPVEGTKWKSFEGRIGVAGASRIEVVVEEGQSTEVPPAADPSPPIDDPIEPDEQVVVEELDEVIIENEAKPPNRKDPDVTTPAAGPTPTLPPLEPPPPPQPPEPPASGTSPPAAPAGTVAPTPSPQPAPPTLTPIAADREIATPAQAPTDAATVAPTATPTRVRVPTATPIPSPAAAPRRVSPSDTPGAQLTEDDFEGPGGCASEEECRAFCQDPANAEECEALCRRAERIEIDRPEDRKQGPGGCAAPRPNAKRVLSGSGTPPRSARRLRRAGELKSSIPKSERGQVAAGIRPSVRPFAA